MCLQVPAPEAWQLSVEEKAQYAHINLKLSSIQVTDDANGILGSSTRMKYNEMGLPIMKAYDADGKGVLDYDVSQYEVESLLSPFPLYLA